MFTPLGPVSCNASRIINFLKKKEKKKKKEIRLLNWNLIEHVLRLIHISISIISLFLSRNRPLHSHHVPRHHEEFVKIKFQLVLASKKFPRIFLVNEFTSSCCNILNKMKKIKSSANRCERKYFRASTPTAYSQPNKLSNAFTPLPTSSTFTSTGRAPLRVAVDLSRTYANRPERPRTTEKTRWSDRERARKIETHQRSTDGSI